MDTDQYQFYKNAQYRNTRNKKRILILDVDDFASDASHLGSGEEFNIDLFEPLIIDKHSEVYLDNFISFNSNISNITANSAFCLKINEFNINSNVASSTNKNEIFNSIVIPNEHSSVSDNHGVVLHKAKKFNYICDINPGRIGRISGKITNLAGEPMFHSNSSQLHFTYTLSGINPSNYDDSTNPFPIATGTTFSGITGATLGADAKGEFLATHNNTAEALHFSTDKEINIPNNALITFSIDNHDNLIINNLVSQNPNLLLTQHAGRFVAEFLIISRE